MTNDGGRGRGAPASVNARESAARAGRISAVCSRRVVSGTPLASAIRDQAMPRPRCGARER